MAVTPEGKIKKLVKNVLAELGEMHNVDGFVVSTMKQFWPVPNGMGASDIDCIVCYYGQYISIETKAPGKKPTPRQNLTLAETKGAGGLALVIASEKDVHDLRVLLQGIKDAHANHR